MESKVVQLTPVRIGDQNEVRHRHQPPDSLPSAIPPSKKSVKKKIHIPPDLPILLEQIAKAILIQQPDDVYTFARDFLDARLASHAAVGLQPGSSQPNVAKGSYEWRNKSGDEDDLRSNQNQGNNISTSPMIRSVAGMGHDGFDTRRMSPSLREKGESLDSGLSRSNDFYGIRSGEEPFLPPVVHGSGDKGSPNLSVPKVGGTSHGTSVTHREQLGGGEATIQPQTGTKLTEHLISPNKIEFEDTNLKGQSSKPVRLGKEHEPSSVRAEGISWEPSQVEKERNYGGEEMIRDKKARFSDDGEGVVGIKSRSQLGPLLFEDEANHSPFQDNYCGDDTYGDVRTLWDREDDPRLISKRKLSGPDLLSSNYEVSSDADDSTARDYVCDPILEGEEFRQQKWRNGTSKHGYGPQADEQKLISPSKSLVTPQQHSLFPKRVNQASNRENQMVDTDTIPDESDRTLKGADTNILQDGGDRGSFEISGYTRDETSSFAGSSSSPSSGPSSTGREKEESDGPHAYGSGHIKSREDDEEAAQDSEDILEHGFTKEEKEYDEGKSNVQVEGSDRKSADVSDERTVGSDIDRQVSLTYQKLVESPLTESDVRAIYHTSAAHGSLGLVGDGEEDDEGISGHGFQKKIIKDYVFDNRGFRDSLEGLVPIEEDKKYESEYKSSKSKRDSDEFQPTCEEEENAAALLIQARYKGYKARKDLFGDKKPLDRKSASELKRRHTESFTGGASTSSPHMPQPSSDEYFKPFDNEMINRAAAKIQAGVKGYLTRKDMKDFLATLPPTDHRYDALKKDLLNESNLKKSDSTDVQQDDNSVYQDEIDEKNNRNEWKQYSSPSDKDPKHFDKYGREKNSKSDISSDVDQNDSKIKHPHTNGIIQRDSERAHSPTEVISGDTADDKTFYDYPDFLDSAAVVIQSAFKSFINTKKKSDNTEQDVQHLPTVEEGLYHEKDDGNRAFLEESVEGPKNVHQLTKSRTPKHSLSDEDADDSDTGTIKSTSHPTHNNPQKRESVGGNANKRDSLELLEYRAQKVGYDNAKPPTAAGSDITCVYAKLNPLLTFRSDPESDTGKKSPQNLMKLVKSPEKDGKLALQ